MLSVDVNADKVTQVSFWGAMEQKGINQEIFHN